MKALAAATSPACGANETTSSRVIRIAASSLLLTVALIECGMAALMASGGSSPRNIIFLICTLGLLGSVAVAVRDATGPTMLVVQCAAAATLLSLFWASGDPAHGGPSITLGRSAYDLTLTHAGLLFVAMLLARLLRPRPVDQACKCG